MSTKERGIPSRSDGNRQQRDEDLHRRKYFTEVGAKLSNQIVNAGSVENVTSRTVVLDKSQK